jgi:hypothetical protein
MALKRRGVKAVEQIAHDAARKLKAGFAGMIVRRRKQERASAQGFKYRSDV